MDFARQLKSAVDIVAVVGERVPLKKAGAYSYVGLCPFHREKSGSFNVHREKRFYYCFGCGASGDSIKFVMEYENITLLEALTSLSERFGIPDAEAGPGGRSGAIMARYLGEIAWETEVWCADAPSHLIHFNGERFLGPYG